jgi:hypothetical protein
MAWMALVSAFTQPTCNKGALDESPSVSHGANVCMCFASVSPATKRALMGRSPRVAPPAAAAAVHRSINKPYRFSIFKLRADNLQISVECCSRSLFTPRRSIAMRDDAAAAVLCFVELCSLIVYTIYLFQIDG